MTIGLPLDTPRRVALSSMATGYRWVTIFAVVVAIFLADTLANRDVGELRSLATNGVLTNADVRNVRFAGPHSTSYYLTYCYEHGGRPYFDEDYVSDGRYGLLAIGSKYPVTYLSGSPWVHRSGPVTAAIVEDHDLKWKLAVLVVTFVCAAGWFRLESEIKHQRRLAMYGESADAEVTKNRPPVAGSRYKTHVISYLFRAGGADVPGRMVLAEDAGAKINVGDHLTVLYDAEDPRRNRPFMRLWAVDLKQP